MTTADPQEPQPPRKRLGWLRHEAIDLGDVAVQIFSVVIGIPLALFINNWVTQRQQQQNIDQARHSIQTDLSINRIALRAHARRMFAMAKTMRDAPANRGQPPRPCFEWTGWNGVGGMNLTDAAYQTAIATQALANMPFKQAELVAQIYGWQHYFEKGDEFDLGVLTQHPQSLELCAGFIEEIGRNDLQLDNVYSRLLGSDKTASPKPSAPLTSAPSSIPSSSRNPP